MSDVPVDGSALYQPLSADFLADPFPAFRRLQQEKPIFWHEGLYAWVLSRYRDCRYVLRTADLFTRDRRKLGRPVPADGMTIQSLDPPDNLGLRGAVLLSIWHANREAACQEAADVLESALSKQPEEQPFDFMSEVAAPAAMSFANRLVGLRDMTPRAYQSMFLRITRAMDYGVHSDHGNAGSEATRELNDIVDAARATAPPGSIIHGLNSAPAVSEMHAAYVRNTVSATYNAAFSTAYSSMGSFLLLCLQRTGLSTEIVKSGNVLQGIKELLRFTSPAQSTARYATCDSVISGVNVRQNDPIITLIAAANRDPEMFERPDELVLNRVSNPHLSFGYGPHHCVGAKPAEEFLARYVERLARWERCLTLVDKPTWLGTATLRCLETLPVSKRRTARGAPEFHQTESSTGRWKSP